MRWQVLSHKSWSSNTICKYYILSSYHPVPWSHSSNTIVSDGRQSHQTSSFMSAFKHQKINSNQHLATTFHISNPASTASLEVKFQYNAQPNGAKKTKNGNTKRFTSCNVSIFSKQTNCSKRRLFQCHRYPLFRPQRSDAMAICCYMLLLLSVHLTKNWNA